MGRKVPRVSGSKGGHVKTHVGRTGSRESPGASCPLTAPSHHSLKPHSRTLLSGPWKHLADSLLETHSQKEKEKREIHSHRPRQHPHSTDLLPHNPLQLPLTQPSLVNTPADIRMKGCGLQRAHDSPGGQPDTFHAGCLPTTGCFMKTE